VQRGSQHASHVQLWLRPGRCQAGGAATTVPPACTAGLCPIPVLTFGNKQRQQTTSGLSGGRGAICTDLNDSGNNLRQVVIVLCGSVYRYQSNAAYKTLCIRGLKKLLVELTGEGRRGCTSCCRIVRLSPRNTASFSLSRSRRGQWL
jgi:hypothetical protein